MKKVRFLNVSIDNLTMDEALLAADGLIRQGKMSFITTPNVDHLVILEKNRELQEAYAQADLVLADGMPLVWFSRFYGTPIKEKISGSDFLPKLCELAAQKGYRIFFLGGEDGVARKASQNLKVMFPELQIVGHYSPEIGFENDLQQMENIDQRLKDARPDILVVALGCPKQEIFIVKNKDRWKIPLSIGVGASLDFLAGKQKRAPRWMSNHGLEWLFRLKQEPIRMFKRYFLRDWRFLKLLWKYRNQH